MNLEKRVVDCSLWELSDLVKLIVQANKPEAIDTQHKGRYMTEKEVLSHFTISESTLRSWVNKKLITKYKVVGNIRFLTTEIEKLIKPV